MTEKRKLPGAALAMGFSGVAVAAAVGAVIISTGNSGNTSANAPASNSELAAQPPASDPIVSAQSAPPQTPGTPAPGAVVTPGAIAFSDPTLSFSAALPSQERAGPISGALRKEAEDLLAKTKKEAAAIHAEAKAAGQSALAWEYQLDWKVLARAGDLVSLVGTLYQFSGGAHGMGSTDTRLANAKTGEVIDFPTMLRFGKGFSPAVVIATCEALKKEKLARIDSATVMDEPIVCAGPNANVRLEDASIAIAPSSVADRFGGLYVYFDPYAVGAYSEGSYQVVIPHEVFAEDLKPQYKALFAGTAPPLEAN